MLNFKRSYSAIFLFVTIFSFASYAPVKAFSITEQLGNAQSLVMENPREAAIGALGVGLLGYLFVCMRADSIESEHFEEKSRIAVEQLHAEQEACQAQYKEQLRLSEEKYLVEEAAEQAQQVAEEERLNSLDIEQFSNYIESHIADTERVLNQICGSKELKVMAKFKAKVQKNGISKKEFVDFIKGHKDLPGVISDYGDIIDEKLDLMNALREYVQRRISNAPGECPILSSLEIKVDSVIRKAESLGEAIEAAYEPPCA